MIEAASVINACGVVVGQGPDGAFAHLATAWSLGDGDWVCAWSQQEPPRAPRLICCADGVAGMIDAWECEDGIAGFTAMVAPGRLGIATGATLHKRDPLWAIGFPSLIDHPAFALHHGSLDAERYQPYLCPWVVEGPLLVFSSQDGYLAGRLYPGMQGGPVLAGDGRVVGVLVASAQGEAQVPLTRFHRLA